MKTFHRVRGKIQDWCHEHKMKRQRYKRGWSDEDAWCVDVWFIRTATPILERYRDTMQSWSDDQFKTLEENRTAVNHLVQLLYKMQDPALMWGKNETPEEAAERMKAKDEFFKLFAEMFYGLWD